MQIVQGYITKQNRKFKEKNISQMLFLTFILNSLPGRVEFPTKIQFYCVP